MNSSGHGASTEEKSVLTDFFRMSDPALVLKVDDRRPVARVEVGFERKKVYVYALFREPVERRGEKRERCSVRKVAVPAGDDWSFVDNV